MSIDLTQITVQVLAHDDLTSCLYKVGGDDNGYREVVEPFLQELLTLAGQTFSAAAFEAAYGEIFSRYRKERLEATGNINHPPDITFLHNEGRYRKAMVGDDVIYEQILEHNTQRMVSELEQAGFSATPTEDVVTIHSFGSVQEDDGTAKFSFVDDSEEESK